MCFATLSFDLVSKFLMICWPKSDLGNGSRLKLCKAHLKRRHSALLTTAHLMCQHNCSFISCPFVCFALFCCARPSYKVKWTAAYDVQLFTSKRVSYLLHYSYAPLQLCSYFCSITVMLHYSYAPLRLCSYFCSITVCGLLDGPQPHRGCVY